MTKTWYVVEGWEERLFDDESDACDFVADMEDFYTDESLQLMCEDRIYEIYGIKELLIHFDYELDECLEYITIEEYMEYSKDK